MANEMFNIYNGELFGYNGDGGDIVIPDGVKRIWGFAFCHDSVEKISSITIPETVTEIDSEPWTVEPDTIIIADGNPVFTYKDGVLYNEVEHKIVYVHSGLKNISFRKDLLEIGANAFYGELDVQEISLPAGVKKIGSEAFNLRKSGNSVRVNIPDGLEVLASDTFEVEDYTTLELSVDSLEHCDRLNIESLGAWLYGGYELLIHGEPLTEVTVPKREGAVPERNYSNCVSIKHLILEEGITEVGKSAFAGCKNLESISFPDSLEIIREGAFACCYSLTSVCFPKNIKQIENEAFNGCEKLTDVELPDQLEYVGAAFDSCPLHFSKDYIPTGNMLKYTSVIRNFTFEKGFLCRPIKFPAFCTGAIDDAVSCAYAAVYQSGKAWDTAIFYYIRKNRIEFDDILMSVIDILSGDVREANFKKAVEFALLYVDLPGSDVFKKFYSLLFDNKSKNLKLLIENTQAQKILLDGRLTPKDQEQENVYSDPIEDIVNKHWKATETTRKLSSIITQGIPYANREGVSSAEAVIFIVSAYADQMDRYPSCYSEYKTSYVCTRPDKLADSIAAGLDLSSLQQLLEELAYNKNYRMEGYLLPFGRYASPTQIAALNSDMRDWANWGQYGPIGRKNIIVARGALMLSDTREAMMAIDKVGLLDYYAEVRGTDADTLRDTVLADFGFDRNGKKTYDLGGNTALISLEKDLSLSIFDENAGKSVKSIPKKGADAALYEKAKSDFSDLKKNIRRVVTNRKNLLFEAFLNGKTYAVENWRKSYFENPVLNAIAHLLVWQQSGKCFTVTQTGKTITSIGDIFTLDDSEPVAVAHPIEMPDSEIKQWQQYFVENHLKQPFEQIWEPVYKEADIKPDRYKGCVVSVYTFSGKEQHGIKAWGLTSYSEDFGIELKDCKLNVDSDTWRFIPGITDDAEFELGEFKIKTFSRYANHIVFMLDRWTIEERIARNDPSIAYVLDRFTVAQLLKFISLASEKNSTDSLAVLMNYKNSKFSEYDPMMEFTLD